MARWEGSADHGIMIKTRVPFEQNGTHAITIDGYTSQGESTQTIGLRVAWVVNNNVFTDATASSSGALAPTVTLAKNEDYVAIFLRVTGSLAFTVRVLESEVATSSTWFSNWTIIDNDAPGDPNREATYQTNSSPSQFDVLTWYTNTEVENGLKIKTNIPADSSHMPVIHVEGFNYGGPSTIDLKIAWSGIEGEIQNATVSSSGGYSPPVYLTVQEGKVVLGFDKWVTKARFKISAFTAGLNESQDWYRNWQVQDAVVTEGMREINYNNAFRDLQIDSSFSTKNASISDATIGTARVTDLEVSGDVRVDRYYARGHQSLTSDDEDGIWLLNKTGYDAVVDFSTTDGFDKPISTTQNYVLGGSKNPYVLGRIRYSEKDNLNNSGSGFDFFTKGTRIYPGFNPQPRLRIRNDGTVCIGTTMAPSTSSIVATSTITTLLAVKGEIVARKLRVTQTGWADYVFEPSYNLRSLQSVEEYVKEHGHLPDVPSAKDVENNGIDVGTTQATLLRKIEELTLYLIEQNKRIEAQQNTINTQQSMLNKLEQIITTSKLH